MYEWIRRMRSRLIWLAESLHHWLIVWILVAYALAAFLPTAGLQLRNIHLGSLSIFGETTLVSMPSLMLAALLFNAGLGVQLKRMRGMLQTSRMLLIGLLANLLIPLLFILGMSQTLRLWHNPIEVQSILVGLALIASMPIAGSSTAWSQNANGDLMLSLGLVVTSTMLSPITTPVVLHAVGWVAEGEYATCLHQLAANGTSVFLLLFVMLPSLMGMLTAAIVNEGWLTRIKPSLKRINGVNLLVLCYANAAVALPQTIANPDWDFLGILLLIVVGLCVAGFVAGWWIAHRCRSDAGQRVALMFGLGMNNNGTGLVLATTALAHLPQVMLPVIGYNLVQHLIAGLAERLLPKAIPLKEAESSCRSPRA